MQRKMGLDADPKRLTKVQTGGPDGDLGSNEIKLGNERTVAVVDGSGVLCDPEGLDAAELLALASKVRSSGYQPPAETTRAAPAGASRIVKTMFHCV